ncbi:MAG: glycosyltransferase [Dokdonella sp.]
MTELPAILDGLGVVYFGNDWYAENRTSSHHVATRLAERMPVLYVDSPGLRAPQGNRRDVRRALRKLLASLRKPQQIGARMWHCTVPQLPFRGLPGVNAFNRAFAGWALRRALRSAGIGPRLSWFVVPHPGFMAGRLDERLAVYYCIDDYAAHPGVDRERIGACDEDLSRRADVLFVAPPTLLPAKRALNPNTHFSPHGVDAALFGRARDPALPLPAEISDIRAPVIGYFGSLHAWIDLELIEWLARARPQWTFLLVGHAAVDVSALAALSNVRLVGPKPYDELPAYAKAFDVAIIPYRLNRQVANANPLKLREYLATGKPVVSVRNAEIERFSEWVSLADSREEFLAGIETALANDTAEAAAKRCAAVAGQSWDARVDSVLDTVAASLSARQPPSP